MRHRNLSLWFIAVTALLLILSVNHCQSSLGDKLEIFQDCLIECIENTCGYRLDENDYFQEQEVQNKRKIPWYRVLAGWSCPDECNHECQWSTINELRRQGFPRSAMPQFYGKWTFLRIGPIQEPASMFFSILNAIATWIGWRKYSAKIRPYLRLGHTNLFNKNDDENETDQPPLDQCHIKPLVYLVRAQWEFCVWSCVMVLSLIAWTCSTVFHTHDTKMTEELDYFSELAFIFSSFCAILIKMLLDHIDLEGILQSQIMTPAMNGLHRNGNNGVHAAANQYHHNKPTVTKGYIKLHAYLLSRVITLIVPCIGYYFYHIWYMHSINFDYGYHMNVNLLVGAATSMSWTFWIGRRFMSQTKSFIPNLESKQNSSPSRESYGYLWKCMACLVGANIVLLLELYDFPPIFYTFDAHALWHASTAPFYLFWYSFLSDEFFTSYFRELTTNITIKNSSLNNDQSDNNKSQTINNKTLLQDAKTNHVNGSTTKPTILTNNIIDSKCKINSSTENSIAGLVKRTKTISSNIN